jgi:phage replication initiation protein
MSGVSVTDEVVGVKVSPPASNTGAEITGGRVALIDWLEVTLPVTDGIDPQAVASEWADILGGGQLLERAAMGYSVALAVLGTGRVLWHSERRDMGVHIILPSAAIGRLPMSVETLAGAVLNCAGHATRVDVAIDSRGEGAVTMDTVLDAVRAGDVVTRCRMVQVVETLSGYGGRTVYLGSPQSDVRVRFYDKACEQAAKLAGMGHVELAERTLQEVWTRCEVQYRREHANDVLLALVGCLDVAGYIRRVIDFRDRGRASNCTRAEPLSWWVEWVGAITLSFTPTVREAEIATMRSWVVRQVAGTLAVLLRADGGCLDWLYTTIREGWERVPAWRRALVTY